METVVLLSSDKKEFSVPINVARKSGVISAMLEDVTSDAGPIPLSTVRSAVLAKVIEYCTKHVDDPNDDEDSDFDDDDFETRKRRLEIDPWDAKLIEVNPELLFEIILAANFLDIKPLLNLGCKSVAKMLKGRTPEEIRSTFNIPNDFTPEEEEQIRKENQWAEDR
ncbi:hypothetical protein H4R35_002942 [Dimargaris xerosporica]|nr:hypothetical protein H4R35_002942 [Dimargaris xerosporica]